MLVPSFFIVDKNGDDQAFTIEMPGNAIICYKINTSFRDVDNIFYRKLFTQPRQNSFCLCIEINGDEEKSQANLQTIIDFMVSASFHSKYLKTSKGLPVFLFDQGAAQPDSCISLIRHACKKSGYDEIEVVSLCSKSIVKRRGESENFYFHVNDPAGDLGAEYIHAIERLTGDASMFFFIDHLRQLPEIFKAIEKAESVIREAMPQVYLLLQRNADLRSQQQALILEISLLNEQLDSLSRYHTHHSTSGSRYATQIKELLRFYNNEYEILPGWFKRLGHLVKVLTGKRTFRSLFNDNVRKYKQ